MSKPLSAATAALLTVPPLLWAGNAIVGRLIRDAVPPMALNLLRWSIALAILLALGRRLFRPGSGLLTDWRRYAVLGLLGVALYNSFQYLALQSSTAINVTLVAAGMPVWMLMLGALFFGASVTRWQIGGAVLSICGVLLVLCRGQWELLLAMRPVAGDMFMILATIAWSFYSWLLTRHQENPTVRGDWAAFLLAQVMYGVLWSGAFTGAEFSLQERRVLWSWPVIGALLYVAIGPAIIAFRCWGAGIARAGPSVGAFFTNLTPLFAAVMSATILGEMPRWYHAAAFALIVSGIVFSARR